ncbi:MAG: hypothetical protein JO233_06445 [Candidatus Eremiobacteraeota bacterium]|nr:hypothetical protein [Candidatus Eremiobacteraeota bacterium]
MLAALLLVAALALPPSRNFIVNGPLAPVWRVAGNAIVNISKPFHFAALNDQISQRDRTIAQLQKQIEADRSQLADRDRQITALNTQINQVVQQAANDKTKTAAKPQATASSTFGSGETQNGSDLSASATADMRRTANYWASMDAENAAKMVQRLPVSYVARIFSLMPADAVGQILNNLSPTYAAQLTQEHPELRR